jgi:hypothetical protein
VSRRRAYTIFCAITESERWGMYVNRAFSKYMPVSASMAFIM